MPASPECTLLLPPTPPPLRCQAAWLRAPTRPLGWAHRDLLHVFLRLVLRRVARCERNQAALSLGEAAAPARPRQTQASSPWGTRSPRGRLEVHRGIWEVGAPGTQGAEACLPTPSLLSPRPAHHYHRRTEGRAGRAHPRWLPPSPGAWRLPCPGRRSWAEAAGCRARASGGAHLLEGLPLTPGTEPPTSLAHGRKSLRARTPLRPWPSAKPPPPLILGLWDHQADPSSPSPAGHSKHNRDQDGDPDSKPLP